MISSAPQCTFYSSCSLCASDLGRDGNFFPLPYMYTAPPCVYKRRRRALSSPLSLSLSISISLSPPRSHTTNSLASPARSPDIGTCLNHLAEIWELPSLSLASLVPPTTGTPVQDSTVHSHNPYWTYGPVAGTRINPCVTVLPLASTI